MILRERLFGYYQQALHVRRASHPTGADIVFLLYKFLLLLLRAKLLAKKVNLH